MLEDGLPVEREPFAKIARLLGLNESCVLDIAREMLDTGYMRRFGPFFDFRAFGLKGYLFGVACGAEAEADVISRLIRMKNVTHVYGRKHRLRIWFTALLGSGGEAAEICGTLRSLGCEFVALAASRMIKLRPSFVSRAGKTGLPPKGSACPQCAVLDDKMLEAARVLQNWFAISSRPFDYAASYCEMDGPELLERTKYLARTGALRRIGASFDHRRAGWTENCLCAFELSGEDEDGVFEAVSRAVYALPWASHCYIRSMYDCEIGGKWPYNLYVMIHASSLESLERREAELREKVRGDFLPLRTEIEYKKIYYSL
jgi:DNA-binding Lrp family transcriptional regulator